LAADAQRYREIVLNLEAGVAVYAAVDDGADFVFVDLNPAGERYCQIKRDAVIGKSVVELFPGIMEIGLFGVFQRVWRSGNPESLVAARYQDDRIALWVENHVFKLGSGEIVSLFKDVSTAKDIEEALRQSETKLQHAQSIAKIGSWYLDVKQDRLVWSDETYRIFGVPYGTALSYELFLGCIAPEDRANVDRAWQAALAGAPYDITHRIVVAGETRWVHEKAELVFDPEGKLTAGVGTVQDVTERKRAEETLFLYANVFQHSGEATIITDREIALSPSIRLSPN